ncbi:acyl-CoA synthetase (NDP forming) [Hydrogenispora ethanolica]|uniref:Acyl-CoA synthetase (NDP forming) n=1 Tax=Hydrogenispora ethanolica TaxID=1082276 RepID=A0A4R1S015_HYDET|nr:acetate--CoA ligase family protein [Hydrogenispora ethanolica]TCL72433.1 acyl-CoA synthetase (NDP forming) [Hydrogenispora ethanolica]
MNLTMETSSRINRVFAEAWAEGRGVLYEFEVYRILEQLDLGVPAFQFVSDPRAVDEELLKPFGRHLMVKIVSPQIAHKQKVGGVKKVKNEDPLFIQFVLERMRAEVLGHFPAGAAPEIEGFLLVELIPHSQALGYETLIGFKEDPAFGPVIALSKGGDDAEFFAKYFNPANLFMPSFDRAAARRLVETLNIRHKFAALGHPEYLDYVADAIAKVSALAYAYSFVAPQAAPFIIKSLDVNPFVFAEDGRFVAIDGFAEFQPAAETALAVPPLRREGLDRFFTPRGVAVIGVSGDRAKYSLGREIAGLLHELGRSDLYCVNARGGEVLFGEKEYPLYKSLRELPGPVELAVYAAPAQYTVDFLREAAETGVRAVILISGIPAELKYSEFAAQIGAVLPPGLRIIGPNCMGVYFAPSGNEPGLNTLFVDEKRLEIRSSEFSNTVLLTQSGAFSVTAIDKMQRSRLFRAIVSFGNKYDVKITDLLAYFEARDGIEVIALYVEGLDPGEGRRFFELARESAKPVIIYKSGRTEAGARAAASHTASMSGSYDVFRAACRQAGVILAETIEELYDLTKVFSLLVSRIPAGNRVAGVVNAGFESTVGADELRQLEQAQLNEATIAKLNRINPYGLVDTSSPFLDVTPMADDRMYAAYVEALLQDENVDCVFVAVVPHAASLKTTPDTCRHPESLANLLVDLQRRYAKPMVISVNAGRYYQEFVAVMEENGLPVYPNIRAAIQSLDAFVEFWKNKRH